MPGVFSRSWMAGLVTLMVTSTGACGVLPNEFNAIPLYRHRVAPDGEVLEVDVLWPLYHFERRADGSSDVRVRPFYRRIGTAPEHPDPTRRKVVEQQFLWPFGRTLATGGGYRTHRVFPFWWWRSQESAEDGEREIDWYAVFPLFWGGSRKTPNTDGKSENYFGFFPFYADLPQFLTYDRFFAVLFPLYFRTEKQGRTSNQFLWPFAGWSTGPGGRGFVRLLPFLSYRWRPGFHWRLAVLYPFLTWATENLDTDDPVHQFFFLPFWGRMRSESGRTNAWTALWPLFAEHRIGDRFYRRDIFWLLWRYIIDRSPNSQVEQTSFFPFYTRTTTDNQYSHSILWPFIWLRRYEDPEGTLRQHWFLPFYWQTHREYADGRGDSSLWHAWPLASYESEPRAPEPGRKTGATPFATSDFRLLDPWPLRRSSADGIREHYDWAWTLWRRQQRQKDDTAMHAIAHMYTQRSRGGEFYSSIPWLYNYTEDPNNGGVLRLFQFLPIRLSRGRELAPGPTTTATSTTSASAPTTTTTQ